MLTDTAERLAANSRWEYNGLPYWGGEVDCCINAWTLANGVWLGADVEGLAGWFVEHRMADGGWNCEWVNRSTRSSFHSTLNALKGLLAHEAATSGTDETRAARHAGEEYLLERGLMRRRSSGELVASWVTRFAYPFRWFYSVLNAADYFRAASGLDGTPPDPRMAAAIEAIRAQRQPDGTWLQARRHPVECGSRSTCRRGSRRSGLPCPAHASWSGGTRRRRPRLSRREPRGRSLTRRGPGCGKEPRLLPNGRANRDEPGLDDAPIGEPVDADLVEGDAATRCRKRSRGQRQGTSVPAAACLAAGHAVALGELVLEGGL